jgi:KRAB domain-containing zinc finger protein
LPKSESENETIPSLKLYKCKYCQDIFYSSEECKSHVSSIHEGKKPFKCIICSITFEYKKDLNEHKVKTHEVAMPYNCGNCNLAFFRKQELLEHEAKNHNPKMECKICVALFDSYKDFYHDPDISFKNPEVST